MAENDKYWDCDKLKLEWSKCYSEFSSIPVTSKLIYRMVYRKISSEFSFAQKLIGKKANIFIYQSKRKSLSLGLFSLLGTHVRLARFLPRSCCPPSSFDFNFAHWVGFTGASLASRGGGEVTHWLSLQGIIIAGSSEHVLYKWPIPAEE